LTYVLLLLMLLLCPCALAYDLLVVAPVALEFDQLSLHKLLDDILVPQNVSFPREIVLWILQ